MPVSGSEITVSKAICDVLDYFSAELFSDTPSLAAGGSPDQSYGSFEYDPYLVLHLSECNEFLS